MCTSSDYIKKYNSTEFSTLVDEIKTVKLFSDEQTYNNLNGTQTNYMRFWFDDLSVINLAIDGSAALAYDADGHLVGFA